MERTHVFAGPYLDRSTHLRDDPAALETARADARCRVIPVWNTRSLVVAGDPPRAALLEMTRLPRPMRDADQLIFLGQSGEAAYFAVALEGAVAPQLLDSASFEDLRTAAPAMPADDAGLLGYARAIITWRQRLRVRRTRCQPQQRRATRS
jgi:NAD+ diphosphatase